MARLGSATWPVALLVGKAVRSVAGSIAGSVAGVVTVTFLLTLVGLAVLAWLRAAVAVACVRLMAALSGLAVLVAFAVAAWLALAVLWPGVLPRSVLSRAIS